MIGRQLTALLVAKGYKVIVLTRKPKTGGNNVLYAQWDVDKLTIDTHAIAEADHIVHLAGEGIADRRWTDKRKQQIRDSRVNGGRTIVKALTEINNKVQTVVSASAMGWYGEDKGAAPFKETDPPSADFLGETCREWEESIQPVTALSKRLVILRTGIVLSNAGGAFREFMKPFKAGLASILGSGNQVVSWIHVEDMCRMYVAAIEMKHLNGVYNAAAPEPVTNKALMLAIAKARKRAYIPIHVPAFVLKKILGEMSIEVLKSATLDSSKIVKGGFSFIYPTIEAAVNDLVRTS